MVGHLRSVRVLLISQQRVIPSGRVRWGSTILPGELVCQFLHCDPSNISSAVAPPRPRQMTCFRQDFLPPRKLTYSPPWMPSHIPHTPSLTTTPYCTPTLLLSPTLSPFPIRRTRYHHPQGYPRPRIPLTVSMTTTPRA